MPDPLVPDPLAPDPLVLASLTVTLRTAGCVFAEDEAALLLAEAPTPDRLDEWVRRRVDGEPLEHIIGFAEFCGLRIAVDRGVFVPRQRTAFLVERAVELASRSAPRPVVVDLCCGCGAIGAAVAHSWPVQLYAADIDETAVRCAEQNLRPFGGQVHQGDLYRPLPGELRKSVDLLLVNAPYVPRDSIQLMPGEARWHEPAIALDGGDDGLDVHRRVIAEADQWLAPGGHLLIETSPQQAPTAALLMGDHGLTARVFESEELYATVVIGTRRSS